MIFKIINVVILVSIFNKLIEIKYLLKKELINYSLKSKKKIKHESTTTCKTYLLLGGKMKNWKINIINRPNEEKAKEMIKRMEENIRIYLGGENENNFKS